MDLRFIESGTNLIIQEMLYEDPIDKEYSAKFYEIAGPVTFLAESDELYKNFSHFTEGIYFKIQFFRGAQVYSFKGKPKNTLNRGRLHLVQIDQMSDIAVSSRRDAPRLEITTTVTLYDSMPSQRVNDPLLSGSVLDLSLGGLGFLSNKQVKSKGADEAYVLEFVLNKNDRFVIPGKLVRQGNSPQSVQYKYDYGFMFDFTNIPDEKARLATSLFNHQKRGLS